MESALRECLGKRLCMLETWEGKRCKVKATASRMRGRTMRVGIAWCMVIAMTTLAGGCDLKEHEGDGACAETVKAKAGGATELAVAS